jgi:hypothetical protein
MSAGKLKSREHIVEGLERKCFPLLDFAWKDLFDLNRNRAAIPAAYSEGTAEAAASNFSRNV